MMTPEKMIILKKDWEDDHPEGRRDPFVGTFFHVYFMAVLFFKFLLCCEQDESLVLSSWNLSLFSWEYSTQWTILFSCSGMLFEKWVILVTPLSALWPALLFFSAFDLNCWVYSSRVNNCQNETLILSSSSCLCSLKPTEASQDSFERHTLILEKSFFLLRRELFVIACLRLNHLLVSLFSCMFVLIYLYSFSRVVCQLKTRLWFSSRHDISPLWDVNRSFYECLCIIPLERENCLNR